MNIPADLLKEAVQISEASSQTMAVVMGLQELIKKKRLEKLASLGKSGLIQISSKQLKKMRSR
ncbi:MAG: hypothetical protein HY072_03390 [Deltaproteobacteria bacterium]|nr:hypothetical protein [Deltaproteobacteria bacterium]